MFRGRINRDVTIAAGVSNNALCSTRKSTRVHCSAEMGFSSAHHPMEPRRHAHQAYTRLLAWHDEYLRSGCTSTRRYAAIRVIETLSNTCLKSIQTMVESHEQQIRTAWQLHFGN